MITKMKSVKREDIELSKGYFESLTEPLIIRGLIDDWPVVHEAICSEIQFAEYLKEKLTNRKAPTVIVDPNSNGNIGYNHDQSGFSFVKKEIAISEVLNKLINDAKSYRQDVGIALQSSLISEYLPNFLGRNKSPEFLAGIEPRLWLGNKTTVPAHYDAYYNIAFVIGGKRTFYLFPPDQIFNLYIGPIDFTPTGPAISLVDIANPDLDRFPKFQQALDKMQVAELSPGDAIYIPPMWWHSVYARGTINGLLNYWWGEDAQGTSDKLLASDALLHAILALRTLPKSQRDAWKSVFDYYIFSDKEDAFEHQPAEYNGILANQNSDSRRLIINWLMENLRKQT